MTGDADAARASVERLVKFLSRAPPDGTQALDLAAIVSNDLFVVDDEKGQIGLDDRSGVPDDWTRWLLSVKPDQYEVMLRALAGDQAGRSY